MVFNWMEWKRDNKNEYPKIHPTQKPVSVLKRLIEIFTDPGDIVIDPVAGSGTTLRAATELGRNSYGFEIVKQFYNEARDNMLKIKEDDQIDLFDGEMSGGEVMDNKCVSCGIEIPEGRQVCINCGGDHSHAIMVLSGMRHHIPDAVRGEYDTAVEILKGGK